jgi:GTP cyclohydrolase I
MQSEQQFARVAAGRLGRKTGHRIYDDDERVDLDAAERAAADFLTALGIDLDREERRATPSRMARAYAELLAARPFRFTTFPNDVRSGSGSCACRRNQQ